MRPSLIALLFPLAFVMAAASPSGEVRDKARRTVYQTKALALCQMSMAEQWAQNPEGGDGAQGCGCAVDAFMAGKSVSQLPPLDAVNFPALVKDELAQCLDKMAKIGVKQHVSAPASTEPPPVAVATPSLPTASPTPAVPVAGKPNPTGADIAAWLAAVPLWAWAGIALAFLLVGARKLLGRDDRRDLLGVPASMRSRVSGQPRRPDLPPD
jgi:hypothetical protein